MNRSCKKECDICRCKGTPLETHHINGREVHNPNHFGNLANICPSCHTLLHFNKIVIEGWVKTTNGLELIWHSINETSFTGNSAKPHLFV